MYLLSVHSVLLKECPSGPVLGGPGCLLVWPMSLHSRVLPFPADSHQVLPDPPCQPLERKSRTCLCPLHCRLPCSAHFIDENTEVRHTRMSLFQVHPARAILTQNLRSPLLTQPRTPLPLCRWSSAYSRHRPMGLSAIREAVSLHHRIQRPPAPGGYGALAVWLLCLRNRVFNANLNLKTDTLFSESRTASKSKVGRLVAQSQSPCIS